jgi:TolA-binding protein
LTYASQEELEVALVNQPSRMDTLQTFQTTAEQAISALQTTDASLQTDVADLQTFQTATEQSLTQFDTDLTSNVTRIEALEAGTENLVVTGVFGEPGETTQVDGLLKLGYDYHGVYSSAVPFKYSQLEIRGNSRTFQTTNSLSDDSNPPIANAQIMISDTEYDPSSDYDPINVGPQSYMDYGGHRLYLYSSFSNGGSFIQSARHYETSITNSYDYTPGKDAFYGSKLCLQTLGGNVGIGTTTPHARLQIAAAGQNATVSAASRILVKWSDYNSGGTWWANFGEWTRPISLYASNDILTREYFVSHSGTIGASDERIKKNIIDADDAECLETLRLLKPKKYQYKDAFERGDETVWGFIAQEVRDKLPYATQLRTDVIPNIYEVANVSQSNVITFTNFNTSNLESNATTRIEVTGIDGTNHDIHLVEVIDEKSIRVEEDLSDWIGAFDESGNVVSGNQLFVQGQEVNDFVFLKKDAIWTVATAALQEIDRQQQADKLRIAELERQLASVLARLDA